MLTTRLIRSSAPHSLRNLLHINRYRANSLPFHKFRHTSPSSFNHHIHRSLCVPQPQPQPLQNRPSSKESPATQQDASPEENPSTSTQKPAPQKESIPDIPSTSWSSIGFEQQDAKDPNKWKKFAWKYAGAVLLFMISYKTLHWYTDRLEADGKRRRKEMEEDREIAHQIRNSTPSSPQSFPFLEPLKDTPQLPHQTSELDELYIYKSQLEQQLQHLQSQSRTSEIRTQIRDTKTELSDLSDEIKLLETKRATS